MNKETMILEIAKRANKTLKSEAMKRAMKQTKVRIKNAYSIASNGEEKAKFALCCLTGIQYK